MWLVYCTVSVLFSLLAHSIARNFEADLESPISKLSLLSHTADHTRLTTHDYHTRGMSVMLKVTFDTTADAALSLLIRRRALVTTHHLMAMIERQRKCICEKEYDTIVRIADDGLESSQPEKRGTLFQV